MTIQEKTTSDYQNKDDVNVVKKVWELMLGRECISQKELINQISELSHKSKTASFYTIKLLCKPIQIGWKMEGAEPSVEFVKEPLLVEFPSIDRQSKYTLVSYWKDYIDSESDVFEKAKNFY